MLLEDECSMLIQELLFCLIYINYLHFLAVIAAHRPIHTVIAKPTDTYLSIQYFNTF